MFRRAAVIGLLIAFSAVWLRAFDLQYGSLFTVRGITLSKGRPVLPLTRGKYVNIRVLDKATFDFLKTCAPSCVQEPAVGNVRVQQLRAARTRPDMWIADVAVDERWLLTLLVFKKPDGFSFIVPQDLKVLQRRWLADIQALVQREILQEKNEHEVYSPSEPENDRG